MVRPRVFFDFSVDSAPIGRYGFPAQVSSQSLPLAYSSVIFELYNDTAAKTVEKCVSYEHNQLCPR